MNIKVALFDTQTSNIKSVYYALLKIGFNITVIQNASDYREKFNGFIFPGVGSFNSVMQNLKKKNLDKIIIEQINLIPSIFICVGMQILFEGSEEFGFTRGLGVVKGSVRKIPDVYKKEKLKVPAIGWNSIFSSNLTSDMSVIDKNSIKPYYFTHSFYCEPKNNNVISSTTALKNFKYCSSIHIDKMNAVQFHPEKSGLDGLNIYKKFYKICEIK